LTVELNLILLPLTDDTALCSHNKLLKLRPCCTAVSNLENYNMALFPAAANAYIMSLP